MARHCVPIPETYLSITRRVARSAVSRIVQYLNLPSRTQVKLTGDAPQTLLWSTETQSLQKLKHREEHTKFAQHGRLEVQPKEEAIETRVIANPIHNIDQPPVFFNPDIDLAVYPVRTHTRLILSCTYRSETREQYTRFIHDLQKTIASTSTDTLFEVKYNMLLDNYIKAALHHAYKLSEPTIQTGLNFREWLEKYSFGHMRITTSLDGNNVDFTIPETQSCVQGWLESTTVPEGQKTGQGANYEVSFDIIVEYDKPEMWILDIPLVICNEVVASHFRPIERYTPSKVHGLRSIHRYWLDMVDQTRNPKLKQQHNNFTGYRIPDFDDWDPKTRPPKTMDIVRSIVLVDETDPHQVMNISELEQVIQFSDNLKRYFNIFSQHLTDYREMPLTFQIYEGDALYDPLSFYIDDQLNIRVKEPLDKCKKYHLTVTFLTDWTLLSEAGLQRLMQVPWITDDFLAFMYHDYDHSLIRRYKGWLEKFMAEFYRKYGRWPSQEEIDNYFKSLHPYERNNFFGNLNKEQFMNDWVYNPRSGNTFTGDKGAWRKGIMKTVGLFTVIANPMDE